MANSEYIPGLPKWPQMLVWGQPVTRDQAKEIIRRTDSFFDYGGGNDRNFEYRWWINFFRPFDEYECGTLPPNLHALAASRGLVNSYLDYDFAIENWKSVWEYIDTQYVHNSWISCAFVGGPHGWCHPDGTISYKDNVGKWPEVEDICNDWKAIAATFPFLNLNVVLMDRESSEEGKVPVIGIKVKNGQAELVWPEDFGTVLGGLPNSSRELDFSLLMLPAADREHGIPDEFLDSYRDHAEKLFGKGEKKTSGD